jgi:hypothetical protein
MSRVVKVKLQFGVGVGDDGVDRIRRRVAEANNVITELRRLLLQGKQQTRSTAHSFPP